MQGFVFNMRRPIFQDRRVREALGYAFDFEWSNKTLSTAQYTRTQELLLELASSPRRGLPSGEELALLEPFRGQVPDEVFTREFQPPDDRRLRQHPRRLRKALGAAQGRRAGPSRAASWSTPRPASRSQFEILLDEPHVRAVIAARS